MVFQIRPKTNTHCASYMLTVLNNDRLFVKRRTVTLRTLTNQLEFGSFRFCRERKTFEAGREPTTNSTYMRYSKVRESMTVHRGVGGNIYIHFPNNSSSNFQLTTAAFTRKELCMSHRANCYRFLFIASN